MKPVVFALIFLAAKAQAAPLPQAVKESWKQPCENCRCHEKGFPACDCWEGRAAYAHLPTAKACEAAYLNASAWRKGVLDQGRSLGYCVDTDDSLWGGSRVAWIGGGWQGEDLRAEVEEADKLKEAWYAAWWLNWPHVPDEAKEEHAARLRAIIGDEAYALGRMPSPIPWWRVARGR